MNHWAILWFKFLTKTKFVGVVITSPLMFWTIGMYMEGERSYGGKQSQSEQKEEAGDGR